MRVRVFNKITYDLRRNIIVEDNIYIGARLNGNWYVQTHDKLISVNFIFSKHSGSIRMMRHLYSARVLLFIINAEIFTQRNNCSYIYIYTYYFTIKCTSQFPAFCQKQNTMYYSYFFIFANYIAALSIRHTGISHYIY